MTSTISPQIRILPSGEPRLLTDIGRVDPTSLASYREHSGYSALERAAAESADGVSFVIMPEGTRSRDGRLLPFKKGPFHLAIDTGLPILPAAIVGSEVLMPKGTWWILPGKIELIVLPPIPTRGLGKESLDALSERTRETIRAALPDEPPPDPDGERSER